jgi:hypothetical protein
MARTASIRRRDATSVSDRQNRRLDRPSTSVRAADFARRKDGSASRTFGKSPFPRVLPKESAFKPHS